jgi:hypothetical protein
LLVVAKVQTYADKNSDSLGSKLAQKTPGLRSKFSAKTYSKQPTFLAWVSSMQSVYFPLSS